MKRKAAALLLALALPASASAKTMYAICSPLGDVNVRSASTASSECTGRLGFGESIEFDGTTKKDREGRTWAHAVNMANESGTGWVCTGYLSEHEPQAINGTAVVRASGRVALRSTVNGPRRRWIHPGDEVTVLASAQDWTLIDGGYVRTEFLQIKRGE